MLTLPIYLDYSATTPVDARVAEKMFAFLTQRFGNPASRSHSFGWDAEAAVEDARKQVAALVNCDSKAIVWTSGATESNNLAIKGIASFCAGKGKHLITVATEHKATLDTMRELERQGYSVTYLTPLESGLVDIDTFEAAIRPDTILASNTSTLDSSVYKERIDSLFRYNMMQQHRQNSKAAQQQQQQRHAEADEEEEAEEPTMEHLQQHFQKVLAEQQRSKTPTVSNKSAAAATTVGSSRNHSTTYIQVSSSYRNHPLVCCRTIVISSSRSLIRF